MSTTVPAVSKRRKPSIILSGILPIDPSRIPTEVIAGATLAALAMPEVMGYANIAQMPVVTGLYTLVLPVLLFAILGSSRHLVVGADSATAAVLATGLAGIAAAGAPASPSWVAMAALAALMCAVFLILARLLRLGFIANFLSRSVLIGFLTGVGIQVALGQVAGMFGVSAGDGTTLQKFGNTLANIAAGDTVIPTLVMSITVLVVIVGLGRVNKRIPGALVAVIGAIALSYLLDLSAEGVTTIGSVPAGLPPIGLPDITSGQLLADMSALLPIVIAMVILILAQSAATSRAYAMKYDDSFDENTDLVGLSLANAAAGISGTFVVNGSPTKTEMVDSAGGRSQIAQLTTGAIVVVVLLFLTSPLSYMPNAVLAAVVFLIGIRLIDYQGLRLLAGLRVGELVVAVITTATVVIVGVEQGIILAIALSIIEHVYHDYHPFDTLFTVGRDGHMDMSATASGTQAAPGLIIYRFGANLFYANASRFASEIMDIEEEASPPLRWIALAASAIGDIDFTGADAIRQVWEESGRKGITFTVCDLSPKARQQLDDYGLTAKIGAENIYETPQQLMAAYQSAQAGGGTTAALAVPQDD